MYYLILGFRATFFIFLHMLKNEEKRRCTMEIDRREFFVGIIRFFFCKATKSDFILRRL